MSSAQLVQIIITLVGIAIAVAVFVLAPYGMLVNGIIAFLIFVAAGTAAGYAYARLSRRD